MYDTCNNSISSLMLLRAHFSAETDWKGCVCVCVRSHVKFSGQSLRKKTFTSCRWRYDTPVV